MNTKSFENIINEAWNNKGQVNSKSSRKLLNAISKTIDLLDSGKIRVAEKKNDEWVVNQWIKKAILLSFRVNKMKISKISNKSLEYKPSPSLLDCLIKYEKKKIKMKICI